MKLENQVVSLEIAKKLKELGVKQESYFYHTEIARFEDGEELEALVVINDHFNIQPELTEADGVKRYSAFTVSELGEMLPEYTHSWKVENEWTCSLKTIPSGSPTITAETEADARGKMLIYLIENNLIDKNSL